MHLVKVKTIAKKNHSLSVRIYYLIQKGKITAYKNQDGSLMYDRDEFNAYRKVNHRGRKPKAVDVIDVDLRKKKVE